MPAHSGMVIVVSSSATYSMGTFSLISSESERQVSIARLLNDADSAVDV
jgi:hypothetical protein